MFSGSGREEKQNSADIKMGVEAIVHDALFNTLLAQLSGLIIQTQNSSPRLFDKLKLQDNETILKLIRNYVHHLVKDMDDYNLMMLHELTNNTPVDNDQVYAILWEACVFSKNELTKLFEDIVINANHKICLLIARSTIKLFERIADNYKDNSLKNEIS